MPQHVRGDLVGQQVQQRTALRLLHFAGRDGPGQQDLDVDLVAGGVHAGGVVNEVGVHQAAGQRVLDPPGLGEPEVAALADDPRPQLRPVDPYGVVGPVARVRVGLVRRLHVGADPAVP